MAAFPDFLTRSRRVLLISLACIFVALVALLASNTSRSYGNPAAVAGILGAVLLVAGFLGGFLLARLPLRAFPEDDSAPVISRPDTSVALTAAPSLLEPVAKPVPPALAMAAEPESPVSTGKRDQEIRASEQRFRELAESVGAVFWMTDAAKNQMIYVSHGYEKIWGRTCASLYADSGDWFQAIHPDDRERVVHTALSKQAAGEYDEEYRILRPDGSIRWIRDRAFPVRNEANEIERIAGIAEDITERKRLEKEVIEISDREQRRLGQDLHDGICQQLVSIAFAADLLRRDLVAKLPHDAVRLARITGLLDNAILQARHLSHALYPVNLVGNGLGFALRELASSISQGYHVDCEAQCAETVSIRDHALATHLYRIAQEAVQNATKHADPSRILICLSQDGDTVHLNVTDNGVGIGDERNFGVGVSIMRYRANMAGGRLQIQRGPFGGTMVSVAVNARPAGVRLNSEPLDTKAISAAAGLQNPPVTGENDKIIPCTFQQPTSNYSPKKGDKEHLADL